MGCSKWRKKGRRTAQIFLSALLMAACVLALWAQPAFASSSSYINSVSIKVDVDLEVGDSLPSLSVGYLDDADDEVMISSNDKYELKSAKWNTNADEVKLGGTYTMKITLDAINDYRFSGSYSSSKVKVKGAEFVSAQRSNSSRLVVTVKTKPAEGELEMPDEAYWESTLSGSDKFGHAKWDSVEDAAYEVALYRGSKSIYKATDVHVTTYNFYPYMTAKGTYTFRVRAVPTSDEVSKYADRSEWQISDELYVESDEVSDGTGKSVTSTVYPSAPETDQVGWIESGGHKFFRYPDGEYVKNDWACIADVWYLFDESGAMLTGWQQKDGAYYFLDADGKMQTGWHVENDTSWYFLFDNGVMATGWLTLGDKTYYFDESGVMLTGWQAIGENTYYFYPDGHMAINEKVDGLFYVDMNGIWRK